MLETDSFPLTLSRLTIFIVRFFLSTKSEQRLINEGLDGQQAIVFHQTFEGLGLSSRIAMLEWDEGQGWRKWMLVLIFASVTPFGMAVRPSFVVLPCGLFDSWTLLD